MIPPKQNAEFVAAMEDVLDVYKRPYNDEIPLICMDEQPVQLVAEVREPLPACPGYPRRYDHHYTRAGTANIFMFTEPLAGWRSVRVTRRRTAIDWAWQMRKLLENDYPDVRKIILVCDNLNTHKIASFYKAYQPALARSLAERIEIHHTPKHGSWLNIAECELSVMTRHCLRNRTGSIESLKHKTDVWQQKRNAIEDRVNWQFTSQDARTKLRRLYPQTQVA